ncbi:MAG: phosphotransferase [Candidatus Diapherotrites archaeon]|nr:phosphotransferase [Candidatus Diapherotrites archaeon]
MPGAPLESRLEAFLSANRLKLDRQLSKGFSSKIFLVRKARKSFCLKIERDDSPRQAMAEREAANLALANSVCVGPKLFAQDSENRCVLMEFVEGERFTDWLLDGNPGKRQLRAFINDLLGQADRLDSAGLDHGQLAGKGRNILVRKGGPVIIDFEKASIARKPHNRSQLESFLFKSSKSAVVKRISETIC